MIMIENLQKVPFK